jgi:hypothetical protein
MKPVIVFVALLASFGMLNAQNIVIRDIYGNQVNNDTIVSVFHPNPNHGWTELSLELFVQNTGTTSITLVAKKTEYNMHPDEYHSICFGGTCFDSSVFTSSFKDPLASGQIDSTFSGHYRFDDLLHTPGTCYVAYTFYNDLQPGDSAIVYIEYNTMEKSGIRTPDQLVENIKFFPIPASDFIQIRFERNHDDLHKGIWIALFNSTGECVRKEPMGQTDVTVLGIKDLPPGIYYLSVYSESKPGSRRAIVKL